MCRSDDPRNKRLRPSLWVETGETSILIDATPDLRAQALRHNIRHVDAVLLTHTHADHIFGLDDLRAFTEREGRKMPLYGSAESLARIEQIFPYACEEKPRWPGLPSFELHAVDAGRDFEITGLKIRALPVLHGRMTVFGFLFDGQFAYLTDCNEVSEEVVETARGVPVLVIDALRHRPHPTHLTVAEALEVVARVKPKLALLTHMCHEVEHGQLEAALPEGVRVAYDGLVIEVENGEWRTVNSLL